MVPGAILFKCASKNPSSKIHGDVLLQEAVYEIRTEPIVKLPL